MNTEPIAHILTADPRERASSEGLAEISAAMRSGWSLAGGSLVRLHVAERGDVGGRSTRDIDVILDVRADPHSIKRIVTVLRDADFSPDGFNPSGHDHRWVRGDAQIDILTPDFLGPRILDRRHPGLGRLLATRGAQFGLHRTRRVTIRVDDFELDVNRPDLVGALYEKCSALLIPMDANKERHLGDISTLANLLAPDDRRELLRLRRREKVRVISGLRRTREEAKLDQRRTRSLMRLERLLSSSLDAT